MKQHMLSIKSFVLKSKRVWHALSKPTKQEFWMVTKVSSIGILVLGFIGFLISVLMGFFQ